MGMSEAQQGVKGQTSQNLDESFTEEDWERVSRPFEKAEMVFESERGTLLLEYESGKDDEYVLKERSARFGYSEEVARGQSEVARYLDELEL